MACALCTSVGKTKTIEICVSCRDNLFRLIESTDVGWAEAVAAATRAHTHPGADPSEMVCSFCARPREQVGKLLAGTGKTYICDRCVALCQSILEKEKE